MTKRFPTFNWVRYYVRQLYNDARLLNQDELKVGKALNSMMEGSHQEIQEQVRSLYLRTLLRIIEIN